MYYIRELLRTAWGITFAILALGSTMLTFAPIYAKVPILPKWLLAVIAVGSAIIAPVKIVHELLHRIAGLELQAQALRECVVHPTSRSIFIREFVGGVYLRTYIDISLTIENRSNELVMFNRYHLDFKNLGISVDATPEPRNAIQSAHGTQVLSSPSIVRDGLLEVQPKSPAGPTHVQFTIDQKIPMNLKEVACTLTLRSTQGVSISGEFNVIEY